MFLVHDQRLGASHFPYHVQGQVMCPTWSSLKKLQGTTGSYRAFNILRRRLPPATSYVELSKNL